MPTKKPAKKKTGPDFCLIAGSYIRCQICFELVGISQALRQGRSRWPVPLLRGWEHFFHQSPKAGWLGPHGHLSCWNHSESLRLQQFLHLKLMEHSENNVSNGRPSGCLWEACYPPSTIQTNCRVIKWIRLHYPEHLEWFPRVPNGFTSVGITDPLATTPWSGIRSPVGSQVIIQVIGWSKFQLENHKPKRFKATTPSGTFI